MIDNDGPAGTCMTHGNPDLWHSRANDWGSRRLAKQLCESCPLLDPCRRMALEDWPLEADRSGVIAPVVVGGLTEREIKAHRTGVPAPRFGPGRPPKPRPEPRPEPRPRPEPAPEPLVYVCKHGHEDPPRNKRGDCVLCRRDAVRRAKAKKRAAAAA